MTQLSRYAAQSWLVWRNRVFNSPTLLDRGRMAGQTKCRRSRRASLLRDPVG